MRGTRLKSAIAVAAFAALAGLASALAAHAQPDDERVERPADEPAFPGPLVRQALRVWMRTSFVPGADVGEAEVSLIRPQLRLRARAPINHRATIQLTASFATSHYDVDGAASIFEDCATCPAPDDMYAASLGIEGGYLINPTGHWLRRGEQWGVLAAAFGRARWESGAFEDSLTGGGSLGLGYDLPGRLRIALGASVESSLDGGVSVGPMGNVRWDITKKLRVRNRSLGAQLEYRPGGRFEYFVTGFRASDRFRLDERGTSSELTWSDRQVPVGAGVEWKVGEHLHLIIEAGAIVSRRIEIEDDGDTIDSVDGDPSGYVDLQIEVRP